MPSDPNIDRNSLWASGQDESVEVNQRALIDKVLARYSGEFTVFRELLQNADDAHAKAAEIHFQTKEGIENTVSGPEGLPDLMRETVYQWVFKNNGTVFQEPDWNRLKKIAEGNPDEQKIGAFGVGFYSLFSITEEPFVKSGDQWMGFYWKDNKDQLLARRGKLPEETVPSEWTSFEMILRDPAPLPGRPMDIARFLASSITFMTNLSEVSLFFNGKRLARLVKDVGIPKNMDLPKGLNPMSQAGMMLVKTITSTPLSIRAEILRWVYTSGTERITPVVEAAKSTQTNFFSSLFSSFGVPSPSRTPEPLPPPPRPEEADPLKVVESSIVLSIFAAQVHVRLDRKLMLELERATKKKSPSACTYQLIFTGKDEYDASKKEEEAIQSTGSVFQGLRADLEGTGSARVYIGHATGQTTGIGGHMAARFIPTVERESIDLVDRNVAQWNKELLHVGGFLCRAAYEMEMSNIKSIWDGAIESSTGQQPTPDEELKTWLQNRCLHALKFFTFHPSTPSAVVSHNLSQAFFDCGGSFPIISTAGVRPALQVRLTSPVYVDFIKHTPTLPTQLASGVSQVVDTLRQRNMIRDISFADILEELRSRPLTEPEMLACLKWRVSLDNTGSQAFEQHLRKQFLEAAVFLVSSESPGTERIVPLVNIQTFISPRGPLTPGDSPFPPHTVPFSLSKSFPPDTLMFFFGWSELTVLQWVAYLVSPEVASQSPEADISRSPIFAERVFSVLSKAWPSTSSQHQVQIIDLLKNRACVPTKAGIKVPDQAYFSNVNVFSDLPTVVMPKGTVIKGNLEKVMTALGVRKHVDLQLVFDRMIKPGDWTITDLMKYLVAVKDTLTPLELDRLRQTAAFPKETILTGTDPAAPQHPSVRYMPSQLYEPVEFLRKLGLPVLDWGEQPKWRGGSEEAKLLFLLGLRRFPPVADILALAAHDDRTTRTAALDYFLDNYTNYYSTFNPQEFPNLAYIPAVKPDGSLFMAKHSEVFSDAACAVLGFAVVHHSLRNNSLYKLKLTESPPTTSIIATLQKTPPQDETTARRYFEYLAGRLGDFSQREALQLSHLPIVPVSSSTSANSLQMRKPSECYFGGEARANAQLHSKLFIFVDFGPRANAFLRFCGVQNEPSIDEIARLLVLNSKRFYELAGGFESYLVELRHIAANFSALGHRTRVDMKKAPILVGSRRVRRPPLKENRRRISDASDEEAGELTFELLRPDQIVIIDDTNAYSLFGDDLYGAPQEDVLEGFYLSLGCPRLSKLVKEEYKASGGEVRDSKIGIDTRKLVLERLPLFLHERTQSKSLISVDWLNSGDNFQVKVVGKLSLTRTLEFGSRISRSQEASAAIKREGVRKTVVLLVGGNTSLDLYEVANVFCKLLFETHRINDSLLFMTILSTDLRSLKRRGFNIDRILNQRKMEKEAQEARQKKYELQTQPNPVPGTFTTNETRQAERPLPIPERPGTSITSTIERASSDPSIGNSSKAATRASSIFNNFRQKLKGTKSETEPLLSPTVPPPIAKPNGLPSLPEFSGATPLPRTQTGAIDRQSQVTPSRDIERNIQMAINACRPERGELLRNREHMENIRESLNDGYCDISGIGGDMLFCGKSLSIVLGVHEEPIKLGEVEKTKFYVSREVPNGEAVREQKTDVLTRFIALIIDPLRQVYNVPPSSVHVFLDTQGPLIAFNRNGSLFLNLRYYEAWHDQQVIAGQFSKALVSWYFTLAHEIAHNLVLPHNSEHEFYFSSLAETHLASFSAVLAAITS